MEIPILALACLATFSTVLVLLLCKHLVSWNGSCRRRTTVMHQSVQPAPSHFALKAGQTLVGVIDTTKVICFYIDEERKEEKPYD
jgi:hypothetical protein